MRYIGVDPDKGGGIAALDDSGRVFEVVPMPLVEGAGRGDYDVHEIRAILQRHVIDTSGALVLTLEWLHVMPLRFGGCAANLARGETRGWRWMCAGMGIPCDCVPAQAWQLTMLGKTRGNAKARAIEEAKRRWPATSLLRTNRSRTDSHGLADAMLIAEYGRRQHQGGEIFARAASSGGGGAHCDSSTAGDAQDGRVSR